MTTTTQSSVPAVPLKLDLRDYFAGQALAGIISAQVEFAKAGGLLNPDDVSRHAASRSYEIADAMLAERAKSQSGD